MTIKLLRIQLRALGGRLSGGGRRGKAGGGLKKLGFALLMLYCLVVFAALFGMFFAQLAAPCHLLGLDWLYFALAALLGLTLMVVGSVFMSKSVLYEAKDNEMLLALPIPPASILASRLAVLGIYNAVFGLLVAGPAGVVWAAQVGCTVGGVLCFLVLFGCLPLLALAVSCVLGWLLALLGSHVRNKTLFSTLFSLLFLGAYFVLYSRMLQYVQQLAGYVEEIADSLSAATPLVWLGRAITEGSLSGLLGSLGCILLPFALVYWLLSATFVRTATTRRGLARVEYKEKAQRLRSPGAALLWKESRRLLTSSAYMLNAGLGLVFLLVAAVYAVVRADSLRALLAGLEGFETALAPLLALALAGMQSMILFSAPALSLEGRSLWLLQSLPITPQQCLFAKAGLHIVLTGPVTLVSGAALGWALQLQAGQLALALAVALAYCVLVALLGVVFNLLFPRLDWVNEMTAVKQGVSVLLTMLLGFLGALVPLLIYLLWLGGAVSPVVFLAGLLVVYAAVAGALARWLAHSGSRRFAAL